ncbi:hypothetical protein BJP25_05590 [Actinokineospora bangkokensis]|uniref:VWFA domain-containing protein n=1 Tax=Actinokineospora bangkokensis TaxID=1193682 RepID=A0A1Q9LC09_9PSEU|nr:hypothetical protein BJP25_05590 [Actinokineospora bangkokensis]
MVVVMSLFMLLTACSSGSGGSQGELGQLQQLAGRCDPAAPPASFIGIDGSGSSSAEAITAERMAAIESVVTETAVCSGTLSVVGFSGSSGSTIQLFSSSLAQEGATLNARLKRVPAAVDTAIETIRSGYVEALGALPQNGSDIVGVLRLGAEYAAQLGAPFQLRLVILSDGVQTTGVDLGSRISTSGELEQLADGLAVPQLSGATVTVAGLGKISTGSYPTPLVEGLVVFYTRLCARTGAARCSAVTDYVVAGR